MTQKINFFIFITSLLMTSCYNTKSINTSIGQPIMSEYIYENVLASQTLDLNCIAQNLSDTTAKFQKDSNFYAVLKKEIYDTTITKKEEKYTVKISEKKKQAFLMQLATDTAITEKVRDKKVRDFFQKTHKSRFIYDTMISSQTMLDTISISSIGNEKASLPFKNVSISDSMVRANLKTRQMSDSSKYSKGQLMRQIFSMLSEIDSLQDRPLYMNESSTSTDTIAVGKEQQAFNQELFDEGYMFGNKNVKSGLGILGLSTILGFIVYFVNRKKVNWESFGSANSSHSSFKQGYLKAYKKNKWRKLKLFFIPIISTVILSIALVAFIGYFGW